MTLRPSPSGFARPSSPDAAGCRSAPGPGEPEVPGPFESRVTASTAAATPRAPKSRTTLRSGRRAAIDSRPSASPGAFEATGAFASLATVREAGADADAHGLALR